MFVIQDDKTGLFAGTSKFSVDKPLNKARVFPTKSAASNAMLHLLCIAPRLRVVEVEIKIKEAVE